MTESQLTLRAQTNQGTLTLQVTLDGHTHWLGQVGTDAVEISVIFDDAVEADHVLAITLMNKTAADTRLDAEGKILEDKLLQINDVAIDEVNIDQLVHMLSTYQHDGNGTTDPVTEKFYGPMGCNGTVILQFKSPVYLWLLEHM